MNHNMHMQKILVSLVAGLLAAGASAQSLRFISAGSGVYSHFNSGGSVSPAEQSDSSAITNSPVTCILKSRTFAGSSMDSQGTYGYEYQITLNGNSSTDANTVTVDSLALNFGNPVPFAYGEHASNFVWVLTSDGPVGVPPTGCNVSGSRVTFQFSPPITLDTQAGQGTNTFYFGLIGASAPTTTTATIDGSVQASTNAPAPFELLLQAQTPGGN
jgi:hypothetical protein